MSTDEMLDGARREIDRFIADKQNEVRIQFLETGMDLFEIEQRLYQCLPDLIAQREKALDWMKAAAVRGWASLN